MKNSRVLSCYLIVSLVALAACGVERRIAGIGDPIPSKLRAPEPEAVVEVGEAGVCSNTEYVSRSSCEKADDDNIWTPFIGDGERLVPDANLDDEQVGYDFNNALRKYTHPDEAQTFPIGTCGQTGSIEARVKNCNTLWSAALGSWSGASNWALVSLTQSRQVWRDERTKMLWSDVIGESEHCSASGNSQNVGFDCTANTLSLCAEVDGLATPDKVGTRPAVYSASKGGLGLASTTPVLWRLPSREDFLQAYANGAARVVPGFVTSNQWTASVYSLNRAEGWIFFNTRSGNGGFFGASRTQIADVRCVGR